MIALVASLLLALYIIVPSSIFRLFFGWYVPLRSFLRSPADEIFWSVLSIFIPFGLALLLTWTTPIFTNHPLPIADTSAQLRRADYKMVFSGIYSTKIFIQQNAHFWHALTRTARRQFRFLLWYYMLTIVVSVIFGKLSVSYAKLESNRFYRTMWEKALLPNISIWHVLLTALTLQDKKNSAVLADILCSDGTLYKGVVNNHSLDKEGQLMGVVLTGTMRFRRDDYLNDREKAPDIDREKYWRPIDGTKFFIAGAKILNMNLTYQTPSPSREKMAEIISRRLRKPITLTFLSGESVTLTPPEES